MNSREEKLKRLEEKIEPLINKAVYIDKELYKLSHYSNIYLYVDKYAKDDELFIDDNICFLTCDNFKRFTHYKNEIIKLKQPIKIKISSLKNGYCIINEENINDIYFINNTKHYNYNDSNFKNNKPLLKLEHTIKNFIYSMYKGPISNKTNIYYLKFREQELKKHFIYVGTLNKLQKEVLDKLTEDEPAYRLNFYDAYLKLYDEYINL